MRCSEVSEKWVIDDLVAKLIRNIYIEALRQSSLTACYIGSLRNRKRILNKWYQDYLLIIALID